MLGQRERGQLSSVGIVRGCLRLDNRNAVLVSRKGLGKLGMSLVLLRYFWKILETS